MSNTTNSTNMNLTVPTVGSEAGPQYAIDINTCLSLIDSHDHSPTRGVQITPTGINISADLPFNSNNLTAARSIRFTAQSAPLALATDLGCLYESGVDLYYNDGAGNQIRITQGGNVAGSTGTITGLPSGTASASYQSLSGTFVFQQATSTAANLDVGSIAIRYPGSYPTPSGNYILLEAPSSLSSGYSLKLPPLPAANNTILTISTAGTIASSLVVDNSTLVIGSNIIGVKNLGITAAQIAFGTITASQIASATIDTSNIAANTILNGNIANATITGAKIANTTIAAANIVSSTITGTQVASNINLPGNTVQENGKNVVVSNTNATASLAIVRGSFDGSGTLSGGEGFSVSAASTGVYDVIWSTDFADAPIVTANQLTSGAAPGGFTTIQGNSVNAVEIRTFDAGGTPANSSVTFIAIGKRA